MSMSDMDKFNSKVGTSEDEFCEKERKTTSQRWVRYKTSSGLMSNTYTFYLRCKHCGHEHKVIAIQTAYNY